MPQCSKCGREISRYGLCTSCEEEIRNAPKKPKATVEVRHTVVCPECGSRYIKEYEDKNVCSMCGREFGK